MSRQQRQLSKQLVTLARQGGGSYQTVANREAIAARIADRFAKLNIQIRDVNNIKISHIELYIRSRQDEDIGKRTLQNEMAALRNIFNVAGRTKLATPDHERLSNSALGLSGTSRSGTKVAITDERYHEALARVVAKDEGVAAAMRLSRYLGLRNEEAVKSSKSLKTWRNELLTGNKTVKVIFGTKGGRARDTTIIHREKVLEALNLAIKYADEHNGKLIDRPTLHSAKDRYINTLRRAGGLTGEQSIHALRYSYAQDSTAYHVEQGFTVKEALALTSVDLGHGDGRGQYILQVYSRRAE